MNSKIACETIQVVLVSISQILSLQTLSLARTYVARGAWRGMRRQIREATVEKYSFRIISNESSYLLSANVLSVRRCSCLSKFERGALNIFYIFPSGILFNKLF